MILSDPQLHWMKYSPKPWQSLHYILHMAVDTHCCVSLLSFSVLIENNLNQKFQIWIHQPVWPIDTDFQAYYVSLFLFVKHSFLTATFPHSEHLDETTLKNLKSLAS